MSEWIKCSERLPEDLVPVIVYIEQLDAMTVAAYDERAGTFVTDCATAEVYAGSDGLSKLEFQPVSWCELPEGARLCHSAT